MSQRHTSPLAGLQQQHNRYFGLRHGQSEANVAGVVLSDPRRGAREGGLTDLGRAQITSALGRSLPLGPTTQILSSDFLRAQESACLAAQALSAPEATLETRLRERWFGGWEGAQNDAYQRVWARDRVDPTQEEDGVESALAVTLRMAEVLRDLEETHRGQVFLLVSHGDPLQLLQTACAGLSPSSHREREHWQPGEVRELSWIQAVSI